MDSPCSNLGLCIFVPMAGFTLVHSDFVWWPDFLATLAGGIKTDEVGKPNRPSLGTRSTAPEKGSVETSASRGMKDGEPSQHCGARPQDDRGASTSSVSSMSSRAAAETHWVEVGRRLEDGEDREDDQARMRTRRTGGAPRRPQPEREEIEREGLRRTSGFCGPRGLGRRPPPCDSTAPPTC